MNTAEQTALKKVSPMPPKYLGRSPCVVLVTGDAVRRFAAWETEQTARFYFANYIGENPTAYKPSPKGFIEWRGA